MGADGCTNSLKQTDSNGVWFVYGSLKPNELGFRQIERFIEVYENAKLNGYGLLIRDGLPGLEKRIGGIVDGYNLYAKPGQESELAFVIEQFEDPSLYEVCEVEVINNSGADVQATSNFLRYIRNGNPESIQSSTWSMCDDPLFKRGLPILYATAHESEAFVGLAGDMPSFWHNYLPVMGTFLNLWTVMERYVAFAQPGVKSVRSSKNLCSTAPTMSAHLKALRVSDEGVNAMKSVVTYPNRHVWRADKVKRAVRTHIPTEVWYQVRNNSAHRGKSAAMDYNLVRNCALGLSEFLVALLSQEVDGLEHLENLLDTSSPSES